MKNYKVTKMTLSFIRVLYKDIEIEIHTNGDIYLSDKDLSEVQPNLMICKEVVAINDLYQGYLYKRYDETGFQFISRIEKL